VKLFLVGELNLFRLAAGPYCDYDAIEDFGAAVDRPARVPFLGRVSRRTVPFDFGDGCLCPLTLEARHTAGLVKPPGLHSVESGVRACRSSKHGVFPGKTKSLHSVSNK
jgi:hypothetical protein